MTKTGELQHEAHEDREPYRGKVPDDVELNLAAGKHAGARNTQEYDHEDEADGHGDGVPRACRLSCGVADDGKPRQGKYTDDGDVEPTLRLLSTFGEDGSIAIQDVSLSKNCGFSCMEAMVIRDTFDSHASRCIPAAPRCLADGRHRHPADDPGDLDAGAGPLSGLPISDAAVHSCYVRTLADLSWAQCRVVLHLQVRKCFYANGRCTRRVFTERLPRLVAPWARRTQRLEHWLVHVALALAGTAGARLSRGLGPAITRNTPALAQNVAQLVRQRQAQHLDPWLARAAESSLAPLQRFAKVLRDDDAVKAGVTLTWRHGPVECPINRLITLTRQMCGRASLERL